MTPIRKVSLAAFTLAFFGPAFAGAQDPTPTAVKPNVLMLIDTSGSMEYRTGSDQYPECRPDDIAATALVPAEEQTSRWIDVMQVLTGTIENYTCEAVDRSTTEFADEYALPGNIAPPDKDYRNPYHRPMSYGCAWISSQTAPSPTAFDWVPPQPAVYPVNAAMPGTCSTPFTQQANGFVDSYGDLVRFGLMTFDTLPDPSIGYDTSSLGPIWDEGVQGAWSYFVGSSATGRPVDCSATDDLEVGVRNAAAPATEGRMIYFGKSAADSVADNDRNSRIQNVLLATRPYGATPLNGALSDVYDFFWNDTQDDPLDSTEKMSPRYDPLVDCGCREQHLIVITDGEPNLDMRPDCEASSSDPTKNGICPFPDSPVEILTNLYNGGAQSPACGTYFTNQYPVKTHIVGFSTATYASGSKQCEDLKTDDPSWQTNSCNNPTDPDLQVCCTLHELADAGSGGTETPYIAPTGDELRDALADIISQVVSTGASATRPVRSPGVGLADSTQKAFRILTSYNPETGTSGLWRGNIERVRITCSGSTPTEQASEEAKGDNFSHNVENSPGDREFITVYPPAVSSVYYPQRSVRPHAATSVNDGLTVHAATPTTAKATQTSFPSLIPYEAMGITSADLSAACSGDSNETACRDRIVKWTIGLTDVDGNTRCSSASDTENCSLIGDVMHSNPVIVDRPRALVEDETYEVFAQNNKTRMMMMYVSSNDGMLHGFGVSPNSTSGTSAGKQIDSDSYNNEHFAFIPPMILPMLKSQYPAVRTKLLDGTAVVQDVVATAGGPSSYGYKLERNASDAADAAGTWRTILVQGFGGEQSGYFALDITDARKPSEDPTNAGPKFLWQITTTSSGNKLFGTGGTPLITTVKVNGIETAVAVLPGGKGGAATGTGNRSDSALVGNVYTNSHYDPTNTKGPGAPRATINTYSASDVAARSLTIVRLDTGEILRTFRNATTEVPEIPTTLYGDVSTATYLDSPITGVPAAFPSGPGTIADRIFVGDQDGVLWRVDVSQSDPRLWEMRLFHDSYSDPSDGPTTGKAITIAPVLSVDEFGNITVNYATGTQDLSGTSGDVQYIYSLSEAESASKFYAKVNWWQRLTTGEHILGPMALQDGVIYFSTLDPAGVSPCSPYPSNIWGVDYIKAATGIGPAGSFGGLGRLNIPSKITNGQFISAQSLTTGSGTVGPVFGVSVEYVPSCTDTVSDANLGYLAGTRSKVTNPSASQMQLVFQTGTTDTSKGTLGFKTGFESVTLAQGRIASTVLSWAALLE